MGTKYILKYLLLAAINAGALSVPSQAGGAGPVLRVDSDYEHSVALSLRELVTVERFAKVRRGLRHLLKTYPLKGPLNDKMAVAVAASPCGDSIAYLIDQFYTSSEVATALDAVAAGMNDLPPDYGRPNPWKSAKNDSQLLGLMVPYFTEWCTFLPRVNGSHDNGLKFIQDFAWFYYQNPAGQRFVQGKNPLEPDKPLMTGMKFTRDFSQQRGRFMDSPASLVHLQEWLDNPRIEIADYRRNKAGEFKSWNEFFAREIVVDQTKRIIPSRPVTMPLASYPERDYIVVSPTDCIMNALVQVLEEDGVPHRKLVDNPLQFNTVLDIKGIPISIDKLLDGVDEDVRKRFVGGTGLSCVLMPNTYHHFHAPVNGTIVHAKVLNSGIYGYLDFPNWAPTSGNVGRPGTDFSQFQVFQRGVIVIEVKYANLDGGMLTGYVALIPVGLNTIGSVVLDKTVVPGKVVKRGYTRLGNFLYGGSLNILLFSKGLAGGAVQTRLGTQINLFNVGRSPD